jgi:hypothetical protein
MAHINGKNKIVGLVGNIVLRSLLGKQVVQSKVGTGTMRQTPATRASSSEFNQCSQWAKILRLCLQPLLLHMTDSTMHGRFLGALYTALRHNTHVPIGERTFTNSPMGAMAGFEFNLNSPFTEYFLVPITTTLAPTGAVTVTLPGFTPKEVMKWPPTATSGNLLLYAMSSDVVDTLLVAEQQLALPLLWGTAVPPTVWEVTVPEGNYCTLITAKLLFQVQSSISGDTTLNNAKLNPVMVLGMV